MSNNLSQLTSKSHITILYFQITNVSTLYKFAICSTKIPCSNFYKATFTTFEIGKKKKKKLTQMLLHVIPKRITIVQKRIEKSKMLFFNV